ncbi:MAG: type II CRISPR RNA-guided endonuclease Cas9 [Pelagibaca sp.]|nr:type II CRISPR RNA-guided endonuclease Cas9 [Pelagibaca sp.]MAE92397.1 type II CRISPR RNA-guided endonuclease Cas9 [Pelagibaca sp.]
MHTLPYTLGLDIGIASVGAALLSDESILGMHVRTFSAAETDKEGDPLNKIRREARSARRRIRRRAHRLLRLRRLLKRTGLISDTSLEVLKTSKTPWQLRSEGLDRLLSPSELAAALYHIVKHRGFQSNRKAELKTDAKAGQMLSGVSANQQLMRDKSYRTIAEMVCKDDAFKDHKRNKGGSYRNTFARSDLADELKTLLKKQREYDNPLATPELEEAVHTLLMARRPVFKDDDIEKLVGFCTFEHGEKRAPKAAFSSERFIWLGKLNNLRLIYPGEQRSLTPEERSQIINLPFTQASVKFSQIRKKLDLPEYVRFNLVRYKPGEETSKSETATFFEAKAFHELRKTYRESGISELWERDQHDPQRLDQIATAIAVYRDDERIRNELSPHTIENEVVEAVLNCDFTQFINLSLKALNKILPYMEQGQRYDEACTSAGYQHHSPQQNEEKSGRIPPPDKNVIRNPVVYRSLNQARKLINAITKRYGAPAAIHLEMARDLSKPFSERKSIEREQEKYRKQKVQLRNEYIEHFGTEPNGLNLLKFRLYKEQDAQCAYTQKALDLSRLNEAGYVEVDHILPYSRSYDDSLLNKTLVLTEANRDKGNRTPFEFMGGDDQSQHWQKFVRWVQMNPKIRQAKRNRYLRKDFSEKAAREFRDRHLNDTRYIGRELKAMIESHVQWHPDSKSKDHCVVLSGQLTALLRGRWGFNKDRAAGDLHHAVDAAVVAAATRGMIQRMARHSKFHELKNVRTSYADPDTGEVVNLAAARDLEKHFPLPWDNFRNDTLAYLNPSAISADESAQEGHRGVRVSRAPTRRKLGAAHQETIRSKGKDNILLEQGLSAVKTPLSKLTLKNIENMVGYEDPRNAALVKVLRERLEAFGGDGAKAFAPNQPPVYKPSKPGKQAPVVRTVNLLATQKSGISVRHGVAANDTMIRTDIFTKDGKFHAVPIYVADTASQKIPNKAVVAYKPEEEWPEMDDSYQFLFSLYPNDWLKITLKKQSFEGYYAGLDRATGAVSLWAHDRDQIKGKNGMYRGIGIKTAVSLEKCHVDILGELHRVKSEHRQPLRKGQEL